ncbi:hypothetical protein LTR09_008761 [Extremus antarcticus]|uniref:Uncharacterized protein n=1 Tax=Extremus antarcticus TaxID=702011 RepID=A0AAJ0G9Y7_9PEZI|nr:hypothetical protein LTR09_008761 [Extremus antarcticus]
MAPKAVRGAGGEDPAIPAAPASRSAPTTPVYGTRSSTRLQAGQASDGPDLPYNLPQPEPQGWKGFVQSTDDAEAVLAERRKSNLFDLEDPGKRRSSREIPQDGDAAAAESSQGAGTTSASAQENAEAEQQEASMSDAQANNDQQSNNGGDVDGDEEARQSLPDRLLTDEERADQPKLRMLHHSYITWNADSTAESWIAGLVNPEHPDGKEVYDHGGQVFRVAMTTSKVDQESGIHFREEDFMVCDLEYCLVCKADGDDDLWSPTEGLPFVHSSDTVRSAGGITRFTPKPRQYELDYGPGYLRRVRFMTESGETSVPARVCGYQGCEVCTGRSLAAMEQLTVDDEEGEGEGSAEGDVTGPSKKGKGKQRVTFDLPDAPASEPSAAMQDGEGGEDGGEEEGPKKPKLRLTVRKPEAKRKSGGSRGSRKKKW